jgi:hypothetical protein
MDVRIEMEVTLLANGDYQIDDLGSNARAVGPLSITFDGPLLEWVSTDPDYPGFVETGSWQFPASDSTTFVKSSEFVQDQGMGGDCIGNGILASEGEEPDAPPAFDPPCTPPPQ